MILQPQCWVLSSNISLYALLMIKDLIWHSSASVHVVSYQKYRVIVIFGNSGSDFCCLEDDKEKPDDSLSYSRSHRDRNYFNSSLASSIDSALSHLFFCDVWQLRSADHSTLSLSLDLLPIQYWTKKRGSPQAKCCSFSVLHQSKCRVVMQKNI